MNTFKCVALNDLDEILISASWRFLLFFFSALTLTLLKYEWITVVLEMSV